MAYVKFVQQILITNIISNYNLGISCSTILQK